MEERKSFYVSIDLKSYFASVECIERNLDPLTTNLVVADDTRTHKTICLAVTPSLKSFGIPSRARLYQVIEKIKQENAIRSKKINYREFRGESSNINEIKDNDNIKVGYIIAKPRMSYYMKYSKKIYEIYLKYVAPQDIYVYSIDEVFIDITKYLKNSNKTPRAFVRDIILDIYRETGITATAGIGTNLYLSKVAMDILAKHIEPDIYDVRIAEIDEIEYRKLLWEHEPITDFWRVGKGYEKKLLKKGIRTMGDIARCSIGESNDFYNEKLLYDELGVNAELLIDHAWGIEDATIDDIKSYEPDSRSLGIGQVLHTPYNYTDAELIIKEMAELLSVDLINKKMLCDQIVLHIKYDVENIKNKKIMKDYKGEVTLDEYSRKVPKPAHGSMNLESYTAATNEIKEASVKLYKNIIKKELLIRKINITANHILTEIEYEKKNEIKEEQLNFLSAGAENDNKCKLIKKEREKEKKMSEMIIKIKEKYGKNAVIKGMNLQEKSTAIQRNKQIGGHKE